MPSKPAFIITIDTEGDHCWSKPSVMTTRNAHFLPRFQQLCEKYRLKPTYLTDWEMVTCPVFQEFARDALKRGQAEIGMHLHAWNSPPISPLTDNDLQCQPYLYEYPHEIMRSKIDYLTKALEDAFGVPMYSHRAGRWGFNEAYAQLLTELNYTVDCSVTPHVSWSIHKGDPNGAGGPDFSQFPEVAYFLDSENLSRSGCSNLLEVPMTIVRPQWGCMVKSLDRIGRWLTPVRQARLRYRPEVISLRPDGRNRAHLLRILKTALLEKRQYVEFMLHSSEFMPGGSPTFPTDGSIDRLYGDLEALFAKAAHTFEGLTLSEYRDRFVQCNAVKCESR